MAGWISSKLKVAENLLHQIDQQAAESLRKNEKSGSDEELGIQTSAKLRENNPLLKEQLKKKTVEDNDLIGKLRSAPVLNISNNNSVNNSFSNVKSPTKDKESEALVNLNPKSSANSLTDSDWTELLSGPTKKAVPANNRSGNGVSRVKAVKRDGIRKGNLGLGSSVVALDGKWSPKGQTRVLKSERKSEVELENKLNGGGRDGRASNGGDVNHVVSRTSTSSVELRNDEESVERGDLDRKDLNVNLVIEGKTEGMNERKEAVDESANDESLHSKDNTSMDKYHPSVTGSVSFNGKLKPKTGLNGNEMPNMASGAIDGSKVGPRISATTKRTSSSPSPSDEESDSETDSASSSDSEREHEREERRKRRQQILAEKAAAKASEAIKERENNVARLEGEKQSLEKILEERAKLQALEASKLQTTTMEIMEAVDLEKQKHNSTRMEALVRLSKLETTNADLARCFASAQKNLELEIKRVSDLREQTKLREAAHEELKKKISSTHQTSSNLAASKGIEFEQEILEGEYSFLTDKVGRLQEKAKTLEANIESTQRDLQNPTEMEIELKRRLSQLTDHLIQKQAQVEALSSEKAMLHFKIETVSRLLDENRSMVESADFPSTSSRGDLESGPCELSNSKFKPLLEERFRSGRQHLGSLVRQLDSLFCSGALLLRRNSTARIWSIVYFACLHLWVIYILTSHSRVSEEARSGAVVSLENINNTGGV